jgi:hypothetical protein
VRDGQTVEKSLLGNRLILAHRNNTPHHQHDLHPRHFVCLPISRGSELPETLRAQIVILKQRGDSWAWIDAFLGVLPETARKTYQRWEETRCFSSAPRAGRPKSFDERAIRHLARHITSSRDTRRQALGEIKNALNLTVCPKTLRNVITKDIGLGHRIERKKALVEARVKGGKVEVR